MRNKHGRIIYNIFLINYQKALLLYIVLDHYFINVLCENCTVH